MPTEARASDVTVGITSSTSRFRASDGTLVRVKVTNASDHPIVIDKNACQMGFDIVRGTKTVVTARMTACPAAYGLRALRAGESFTFERRWHGSDWNWEIELTAGTYELRGKVRVGDATIVSTPVGIEKLPD